MRASIDKREADVVDAEQSLVLLRGLDGAQALFVAVTRFYIRVHVVFA